MARRKVTVFGGTGFLGHRVVQRLLEHDFSVRVAVQHPERIAALFPALHFDAIQADVNDDRSVAAAVASVEGVVNAVSLYAESGSQTFHSVHVEAATKRREAAVREPPPFPRWLLNRSLFAAAKVEDCRRERGEAIPERAQGRSAGVRGCFAASCTKRCMRSGRILDGLAPAGDVENPLSLCFGLSISWSGKRNFAG